MARQGAEMPEPAGERAVERWLEARRAGDMAALAALTAPDAEWESPVNGVIRGRDGLLGQVAEAFEDTDRFATETLAVEVRGDRAAVVIRNTGHRHGEDLDSLQTLFITLRDGLVQRVRVAVDEPSEVEEFWSSA